MSEKRQCTAIKAGGGRCSNKAQPGQGVCWSHNPANRERVRANAAKGGQTRSRRPVDELENIKGQVKGIAARVFQGSIDRSTAAVLGQLYNVLLRSVEIQRRLDHQRELEEQVADLRTRLEEVKRKRWAT